MRRRKPTLREERDAALWQLGRWTRKQVQLDHDPALGLRERTPDGGYRPPENDPKFMVFRPIEEHKTKTFGPGGEKRITTAGGDIHTMRKSDRLRKEHEDFRARMLKPDKKREKPKSKWPKRPMGRRKGR